MKWKSVCDDVPYKNQLCLCRKPYSVNQHKNKEQGMTTRRNNMFYYRGACPAYSTILEMEGSELDG